jgi:hypothetical protein
MHTYIGLVWSLYESLFWEEVTEKLLSRVIVTWQVVSILRRLYC